MPDQRELRFDVGALGRAQLTQQGFVKIPGNLTRIGVLTYHRADGTVFRELRHPDEVFKADSVASLEHAPVTYRHPPALVTARNVREFQVGVVAAPRVDDRFISGDVIVQDAKIIEHVQRGDARELSPGYTCRVEQRAGVWGGAKYDGIQRGITYNHLAIGPRDWGRSGPEVALHVDHGDAPLAFAVERYDSTPLASYLSQQLALRSWRVRDLAERVPSMEEWEVDQILYGWQAPTNAQAAMIARALELDPAVVLSLIPAADRRDDRARGGRRTMDTVSIKIDSVDYEDIPRQAAQVIERELAKRTDAATAEKGRADTAEGKLDAVTKERDELKTKLDAAASPDALAKAVKARVDLEAKARRVLGADAKTDGLSDRELRVAVIVKTDEKFDAKDRSDEYVAARFDGVVSALPEGDAPADRRDRDDAPRNSLGAARKAVFDAQGRRAKDQRGGDETREVKVDSSDGARKRAEQRAAEMWKPKAARS